MRWLLALIVAGTPTAFAAVQQAQTSRDPGSITLTFENNDYAIAFMPKWRVTVTWRAIEWLCLEACADAGPRYERISEADFDALVRAVHEADFFNKPRRIDTCMDCGANTLTYADDWRRHDVTVDGPVGPALTSLFRRFASTAIRPFERFMYPSVENYEEMWRRGERPDDDVLARIPTYHKDAFALLLRRGVPVTRSAWMNAGVDSDTLAMLLKHKRLDPRSETARALFVAAAIGKAEYSSSVTMLLALGVDVNARDPDTGRTALMNAGWATTAMVLLSKKANPRLVDDRGRTALWYAAGWEGTEGALPLLLAVGGNVDQADSSGITPLMRAAQECAEDNVELFVKAGADIKRTDKRGRSVPALVAETARFSNGCEDTRETVKRLLGREP